MPTIKLQDGRRIKVPDDYNDDQINEIVEHEMSQPSDQPPQKTEPSLGETIKNQVAGFGAGLTKQVPGSYTAGGILRTAIDPYFDLAEGIKTGELKPTPMVESFKQGYSDTKRGVEKAEEKAPIAAGAGQIVASIPEYTAGMGALGQGGALAQLAKGALVNTAIGQGARGPEVDSTASAIDAAGGVVGEGLGLAGGKALDYLSKKPAKLINSALNPTLKSLERENIGQDLVDRGIYGTTESLQNKAEQGLAKYGDKGALGKVLKNAKPVNEDTVLNHFIKEIDKYKGKAGYEDYAQAIQDEADKFLTDPRYRNMSAKQANQFKRDYSDLITDAGFLKDNTSATLEAKKVMRKALQNAVEEAAPQSKKINEELGVYKQLKQLTTKAAAKEAKSAQSGLTRTSKDIFAGIVGSSLGGPAGGATAIAGREALNTTLGKTGSAIALKNLTKILEKAGKKGISPRLIAPIVSGR